MHRTLPEYEAIIGPVSASKLKQVAADLKGARVVHVNSTREGGGVAEILFWMIPLMNELGLEASWEVIEGNPEYFNTTKSFHNGLQGNKVVLTDRMIRAYEDTVAANADRLRPVLQEADFVIIHDPQPAMLHELCPNRKGKWIWRCHIDVSKPNRKVWNYISSKVDGYDVSIFSMPDFARKLNHPQFIIAPSIDPLSDKNVELSEKEINRTLAEFEIDHDRPILCQISRFDRFKDPIGVIQAFKLLNGAFNAQLVLAGGGATDDPEGAAVLDEVMDAVEGDDSIHVLMLPPDAHKTINALQRASTIIIQKSLQEGFGLTVTEAMWKHKPVIGGNTGGIRLQVHHYHTGFLVNTPDGAALRIRKLLSRPDLIDIMGATAKEFVKENYLCNRQLRENLTLMLGLRRGLSNHLITD
ncbi:MAG: glycosyltransferase [Candidatus Zixiibacteriota bacterium]|nr:MAG: glycosyltransferase [candidate division Zixibacteria bacterium]